MTAAEAPKTGDTARVYSVVIAAASLGRSARTLPLGAARIVSSLRAHPGTSGRVEASLLSALASDDPGELADRILALNPDAVGFSLFVWNRLSLLATARLLRMRRPGLLLFAGGPEATADCGGVLEEGSLDFAVAGEGEEAAALALREILDGKTPGNVPGVRTADRTGSPHRGGDPLPANLADLSSPYLDGVLDPGVFGGALWELARGCPFSCAFCYESKGARGVRRFPDAMALAELRLFARSGVKEVFVLDPTFNADPAKAREVLDLIRREAPSIHFTFEARAEFLDAPLVRGFRSIPCSVQIGLQSARTEVLDSVGRPGFNPREFRRKMAMLSGAGVVFGLDLIYGLPGDDFSGFRESLDFALGLAPNHLDIFRLSVLPGTVLADKADELKLEREKTPPYGIRSSPAFSAEDLGRAESLARSCGLFYSTGRAVGWFLSVLKPLRTNPSAFLEGFAGRAEALILPSGDPARDPTPKEIEGFQLDAVAGAYRAAGVERLFPAARDLIRLHGAWNRALAEGESEELTLAWDPDDLFGPASRNLPAFFRSAPRQPGVWVVHPGPEGPVLEPANKIMRR